jgi:membrane protein DedA with SNARE-associated domain
VSLGEHVLPTLFGALLAHQLGIPIPAFPLLIWAGAISYGDPLLVGAGLRARHVGRHLRQPAVVLRRRRYGYRMLKLVCRITLSPDSCVRQTENAFDRRGPSMLVVSRFLPGIETVAPPLAGALSLPVGRFILYDAAGSALRAAAGLALGLVFHDQVGWLLDRLTALGSNAVLLLGALVGAYVAWRFAQRWRFLRSLRTARISVHELNDMMSRGEDPVVLDVRTAAHRRLDGRQIPGGAPGRPRCAGKHARARAARRRSGGLLRLPQRSHGGESRAEAARPRLPARAAARGRHRCLDVRRPCRRADRPALAHRSIGTAYSARMRLISRRRVAMNVSSSSRRAVSPALTPIEME